LLKRQLDSFYRKVGRCNADRSIDPSSLLHNETLFLKISAIWLMVNYKNNWNVSQSINHKQQHCVHTHLSELAV